MKKYILIGDVIISVFLILLSILILVGFSFIQTDEKYVEIIKDDVIIEKIKITDGLSETITITGELITNEIHVDETGAQISHANCFDQVCVHTGHISDVGSAIVCLPNKVIVRITGEDDSESEVDIVAN